MTKQLVQQVNRFGRLGALLAAAAMLPACGGDFEALEDGDVAEVSQADVYGGTNNLPPYAIDSDPLKRSVTNAYGITTPNNPDPIQLCADGSITDTGCTLRQEWRAWMNADLANRTHIMKGLAKCSVAPDFTIRTPDNAYSFAGQWENYPGWKGNRLNGQDKRERVSSCLLSLLNGNNLELLLCIIGPGGSPFSDPCGDEEITTREGGFYGDLFAATPTAYIAGPDTANPVDSGRVCTSSSGQSYCCAENDTNCNHRIVLTGAILGSPAQNFANKRCNATLVNSGGFEYCPSFYTTREPGRNYTNVFTSFVPQAR